MSPIPPPRATEARRMEVILPDSSLRPDGRVGEDKNNSVSVSGSAFEALAEKVLMGEKQFALEHSVLQSGEKRAQRHDVEAWQKARWWLMSLSLVFAVVVLMYQAMTAVIPRFSRVRRVKGPRLLNWMLGRLIHPLWEIVREGVVTSGALDVIYNIEQILPNPKTRGERFMKFLLHQPDGQAVTNRLKRTHYEIYCELERLAKLGLTEIRIASLACGSAQAMIEAVVEIQRQYPTANIKVSFVDLNEASLDRARELVRDRGVDGATFEIQKLQEFLDRFPDGHFHLVEMVGFLDYSKDKDVVRYCNRVKRSVCDGGLFIGAMIGPNPWQFVVRWTVGWPLLLRRTPEQYHGLLVQAWDENEVRVIPDPHRIHSVSLCRKSGTIDDGGERLRQRHLKAA